MASFTWIPIIISILLIFALSVVFFTLKIQKEEYNRTGKHPVGHYMGLGMAIGLPLGMPLGIPIGFFLDNITLGLVFGLCMGVAIGSFIGVFLEKRHENELRTLTKKEEKFRNITMLLMAVFLIFGVIVFLFVGFI